MTKSKDHLLRKLDYMDELEKEREIVKKKKTEEVANSYILLHI